MNNWVINQLTGEWESIRKMESNDGSIISKVYEHPTKEGDNSRLYTEQTGAMANNALLQQSRSISGNSSTLNIQKR